MKSNKAKFVWKLAWRDVIEDRRISTIVVIMLSFAFLNLVFFPAFIDGLSHTFTEGLIEGQTGHLAIEADEGRLEKPDSLVEQVERMENVEEVEKVLEKRVVAEYSSENTSVVIRGSTAHDFKGYTSKLKSGEFLKENSGEVVVGRFLTEDKSFSSVDGIGIDQGRVLTLYGEDFREDYRVRGIIGTKGGIGGFSEQIYLTYDEAAKLLNTEDADMIKIILDDRNKAEEFKNNLQELNTRGEIKTWREQSSLADAINATFAIVINVLSAVGLIVALAAIGVVIFINTSKRIREMGIIRAIGAQKTRVIQIFVLEAFIFGLAGILIGNILTLSINAYLTSNPIASPVGPITTKISAELLATRSIWMLTASIIAGFIPAYLTSQTEIVETIENR